MKKSKMTGDERRDFVELYSDLEKIVIDDISIDQEFARRQIERIDNLLRSGKLDQIGDGLAAKYRKLRGIFSRFAGN